MKCHCLKIVPNKYSAAAAARDVVMTMMKLMMQDILHSIMNSVANLEILLLNQEILGGLLATKFVPSSKRKIWCW